MLVIDSPASQRCMWMYFESISPVYSTEVWCWGLVANFSVSLGQELSPWQSVRRANKARKCIGCCRKFVGVCLNFLLKELKSWSLQTYFRPHHFYLNLPNQFKAISFDLLDWYLSWRCVAFLSFSMPIVLFLRYSK